MSKYKKEKRETLENECIKEINKYDAKARTKIIEVYHVQIMKPNEEEKNGTIEKYFQLAK
jgi:hypothetical protein